jgi:hypothetical protein
VTGRRLQLRTLAPASLALFAVALLLVIALSLGGDSGSGESGETTSAPARSGQRDAARRAARSSGGRRVYRVRAGDTLASIADRTEVPLQKLLELNPSVDPQGLVTGQRIRLR